MGNNAIISGFDDTTDQMLEIKLELIKKVDSCCIVHLKGVVDTYNSIFFQDQMNKVIHAGFRNIIISGKELKYISSTGIGDLVILLKHLKMNNGRLILTSLQENVIEVLSLLGFRQFFCVKDSIEEALADLTKNVIFTVEAPAFPIPFSCPLCEAKLKAPHSGKYRCLSCKSIIRVTDTNNKAM